MSFTNTPERYGVISAAFHWLSAIIVYGMFALGLWMVTLSYYDGWYHKAPELHKSIGILLMMGPGYSTFVACHISTAGSAAELFAHDSSCRKGWTSRIVPIAVRHRHQRLFDSTADGKPISVFGGRFDRPVTLADAGAQADFAGALHFWLAWSVVVLSVMHGFMALKHHFGLHKHDTLSACWESRHLTMEYKILKKLLGLTF